jgi:spore coat protein A
VTTRFKLLTFLAAALAATAVLAAPLPLANQTPLAAGNIPQWKSPLPLLSVYPTGGTMPTYLTFDPATGLGTTSYTAPLDIRICEFKTQVLPTGFPATWTWGYWVGACPNPNTPVDTYLGPVLVNLSGQPTTIRYINDLPTVDKTNVVAYKYSTDQTLHWADPLGAETNFCHEQSMTPMSVDPAMPFQPGYGVPTPFSPCSLNFGESPAGAFNPVGIPAVPHLHGGEVPPVFDGGPDAWFTSPGAGGTVLKGHDYYTNPFVPLTGANQAAYTYFNTQGQAPLWFHDHTLGATRLNVYAGIAGAYYLLEKNQEAWFKQIGMRPITELVPIVLQDRMFDTTGQFYFPQDFPGGINGPPTNPQHPYWNPEFIGDTIVVNGKAWPFLNVEPRRYRFLFLNGSNARTYETFFVNPATKVMGPVMWTIGNDGGILDWPSIIDPNAAKPIEPHFIIMPGERYEIIVDFTNYAGQTLVLKNVAKAPFPGGATPQGGTTGQIVQFRVSATKVADTTYNPALNQKGMAGAVSLRPTGAGIVRLVDPATGTIAPGVKVARVRQLTLNEVAIPVPQTVPDPITGVTQTYPGGPVEILVNNTKWSGHSPRLYGDFTTVTLGGVTEKISETPHEGDIELWEIINTTADAHPIHTHLTTFQVLNRQAYNTGNNGWYNAKYATAFPGVAGSLSCPKGLYCPGFGPPLAYGDDATPNFRRVVNGVQGVPVIGGNPDITLYLSTLLTPPDPDEVGWKDTFLVYPGMVNRFLVRFSPTDTALNVIAGYPFSPNDGTNGAVSDSHAYVWHCHIIDHEDNEMMRQHIVVPLAGAPRTYVKGVNY